MDKAKMDNLFIPASKFVPEVNFNASTGELTMTGQSYHENANEFYDPILEWMQKFEKEFEGKITLNFKLTYFNTPVSRIFIQMLRIFEKHEQKVIVNWYYPDDDDDLLEDGRNLQESTKLKTNLIAY
jgi:hypothetical protein